LDFCKFAIFSKKISNVLDLYHNNKKTKGGGPFPPPQRTSHETRVRVNRVNGLFNDDGRVKLVGAINVRKKKKIPHCVSLNEKM